MGELDELLARVRGGQQQQPPQGNELEGLIAQVRGGGSGAPQAEMTVGEPTVFKHGQEKPIWDPGTDPIRDYANSPEMAAESERLNRFVEDPGYALRTLGATGANYLGGIVGLGGKAGVLAQGIRQGVAGGLTAGAHAYAEDPDDWTNVLVQGGKGALVGGLTGAGLTSVARGFQGAGNSARAASLNASPADLRELGMTQEELVQMSDRLGVNNDVIPMSRAGKLARVDQALATAGPAEDAAIREANAALPPPATPYNQRIAQDIDFNADRVWTGGSPRREGIVGQMGKAASAAQDHQMDDLMALREYKSARGSEAFGPLGSIEDSNAAKASLAGYDSAAQALDQRMYEAGPAINGRYQGAKRDYADASTLEDLLTGPQRPPGVMGDVAAGMAGAAIGGGSPMAVGAGIGARRAMAPYMADAAANFSLGAARNLDAASNFAGPASGEAVQQWLSQKGVSIDNISQQTRGNRSAEAAVQLFQQNPQAFGEWQPEFADAVQRGPRAVGALIGKLEQDPRFRMGPYKQIQQATAGGGSYAQ